MSLVGTLGRLAVGALVAKGASKFLQNKMGGGNRGGATGMNQESGGIGGLLGGNSSSSGGSLTDLLGGGSQGGGLGGGLGGLLESLGDSLGGGGSGAKAGGAAGGLGGLLNSVINGQAAPTVHAEPEQENQAAIMLRAMLNAAKCDGRLDEEEKSKITSQLGDLSQDDVAFIQKEMSAPLDMPGFIKSVPRGMEQQAYLMSLMAIDLDSKAEAEYLDNLAKGMGISESVSNQIHQKLGAPTLYT